MECKHCSEEAKNGDVCDICTDLCNTASHHRGLAGKAESEFVWRSNGCHNCVSGKPVYKLDMGDSMDACIKNLEWLNGCKEYERKKK